MILRVLDFSLCISTMLDLLAQPQGSIPYDHMVLSICRRTLSSIWYKFYAEGLYYYFLSEDSLDFLEKNPIKVRHCNLAIC